MTGKPGLFFVGRRAAICAVLLVGNWTLSACTFVPVAELRVFRESVVVASSSANLVLDEAALAERQTKARVEASGGSRPKFDPNAAGYFSSIGDPPGVEALRRSHNVYDQLSAILVSLAEGRNVQDDVAALDTLTTEATALASVLTVIAGGAALAPGVSQAFELVEPLIKQLGKEKSRREVRRLMVEIQESGLVDKLVDAMIGSTRHLFDILIAESDRRAYTPGASADVRRDHVRRIERTRGVLSTYVVLLRRSKSAFNQAATALALQQSPGAEALALRIGELRAAAETTRRAVAELRGTP